MSTALRFVAAWLGAVVSVLLRLSCRVRFHDDPRPALRARGSTYAYAFLHAHQVATVIAGEPGTGAMVSRSRDGDVLVPALRARGVVPVRGSGSKDGRDKGGRRALQALIEHARAGRPVYFAVDGPRGPRGRVRRGVAELSVETGAAILPAVGVPTRKWVLTRTWDRFEIPKPFCRIDIFFGPPLEPSGEVESLRAKLESELARLERAHAAGE